MNVKQQVELMSMDASIHAYVFTNTHAGITTFESSDLSRLMAKI